MAFQKRKSRTRQTPLFVGIDPVGGMPAMIAGPRLHLDKHHSSFVDRHQIDLSDSLAIVLRYDPVAQLAKITLRSLLATLSQGTTEIDFAKPPVVESTH